MSPEPVRGVGWSMPSRDVLALHPQLALISGLIGSGPLRRPRRTIPTAIHCRDQARRQHAFAEELDLALSVRPNYVALGPIWKTTLKQMPWSPQGLDRLTNWKRRLGGLPLVAIGGITLERAPSCLRAGADAIAVVLDVTGSDDPDARARAFQAALDPMHG